MKEKLKLIEEFYTKAWEHIVNKDVQKACLVLYTRMPANLYDMSLDILLNRNLTFSNKDLKTLIEKVDSALCQYSEDDELLDDNFSGQY